jgi:hypothetical protein
MGEPDIRALEDAVIQAEMNLHGARAQEAAIQHRIDVLEPERMCTLVKMLEGYKEATARAVVALAKLKQDLLLAKGSEHGTGTETVDA